MNITHYHKQANCFNIVATDKHRQVHTLKLDFEQLPDKALIDEINAHKITSELQLLINNPLIKTTKV